MAERSALLSLSQRVAVLERNSESMTGVLSRIEAQLVTVQKSLLNDGALARNNRNWLAVVFVTILAFAVYVTLVNTPAGLRLAEAGLPPTVAEPGTGGSAPTFGVARVKVVDGTGRARVRFAEARLGVPVVQATPHSFMGGPALTASIVAASTDGFEVQVSGIDGVTPSDSISVHWVAYR